MGCNDEVLVWFADCPPRAGNNGVIGARRGPWDPNNAEVVVAALKLVVVVAAKLFDVLPCC